MTYTCYSCIQCGPGVIKCSLCEKNTFSHEFACDVCSSPVTFVLKYLSTCISALTHIFIPPSNVPPPPQWLTIKRLLGELWCICEASTLICHSLYHHFFSSTRCWGAAHSETHIILWIHYSHLFLNVFLHFQYWYRGEKPLWNNRAYRMHKVWETRTKLKTIVYDSFAQFVFWKNIFIKWLIKNEHPVLGYLSPFNILL